MGVDAVAAGGRREQGSGSRSIRSRGDSRGEHGGGAWGVACARAESTYNALFGPLSLPQDLQVQSDAPGHSSAPTRGDNGAPHAVNAPTLAFACFQVVLMPLIAGNAELVSAIRAQASMGRCPQPHAALDVVAQVGGRERFALLLARYRAGLQRAEVHGACGRLIDRAAAYGQMEATMQELMAAAATAAAASHGMGMEGQVATAGGAHLSSMTELAYHRRPAAASGAVLGLV